MDAREGASRRQVLAQVLSRDREGLTMTETQQLGYSVLGYVVAEIVKWCVIAYVALWALAVLLSASDAGTRKATAERCVYDREWCIKAAGIEMPVGSAIR